MRKRFFFNCFAGSLWLIVQDRWKQYEDSFRKRCSTSSSRFPDGMESQTRQVSSNQMKSIPSGLSVHLGRSHTRANKEIQEVFSILINDESSLMTADDFSFSSHTVLCLFIVEKERWFCQKNPKGEWVAFSWRAIEQIDWRIRSIQMKKSRVNVRHWFPPWQRYLSRLTSRRRTSLKSTLKQSEGPLLSDRKE